MLPLKDIYDSMYGNRMVIYNYLQLYNIDFVFKASDKT